MYADDTTLFCSCKSVHNLFIKLIALIQRVYIWLKANFLSLNFSKTKYMFITYNFVPDDLQIKVNNFMIEKCKCLSFLGVTIDQKILYHEHLNYVVSNVSSTQGIIFKLNYLPTDILLIIYYSLVFPYLFYCIEIWGACPASTSLPLYRLQKKLFEIFINLNIMLMWILHFII